VQSLGARSHRLNFYFVLRKLITELQAFSQRIQETSMVRSYSSIYSDDKMLKSQMSVDGAFHAIPQQIAAAHRTKAECLGSVPLAFKSTLIRGVIG
jgi:hypothetical protein